MLLNPSSTPISTRFSIHCDHSNQPVSTSPSFPPDTKSFLYYFTPPEKPRIAGELRIRIVSSDDPASFESGSDLLLRDGRLWLRPLYFLSKIHISVYEKLREERLVPDDLDTALSTLPSKYPTSCRSQLLYTLNDTFIIDLGSFSTILFVITEQGVATLPLRGQILDGRRNGGTHFRGAYAPYKGAYTDHHLSILLYWLFVGSALVRFEKSTLPAHKGTRTVVLRFLKIITPVKCVIPNYDGYICCPKEGELHRRSRMLLKMDNSVWNVNIDKSNNAMIRAFRLLWDA